MLYHWNIKVTNCQEKLKGTWESFKEKWYLYGAFLLNLSRQFKGSCVCVSLIAIHGCSCLEHTSWSLRPGRTGRCRPNVQDFSFLTSSAAYHSDCCGYLRFVVVSVFQESDPCCFYLLKTNNYVALRAAPRLQHPVHRAVFGFTDNNICISYVCSSFVCNRLSLVTAAVAGE